MGKIFKFKLQVNLRKKSYRDEMPKGTQIRCRDGINNPILTLAFSKYYSNCSTKSLNQDCVDYTVAN